MVKINGKWKSFVSTTVLFPSSLLLLLLLLYIFHFAVELNARRHEHLVTVINFFLTAFLEFIKSSAWLSFYFFIASMCLILTRINAVLDVKLNEIWWKISAINWTIKHQRLSRLDANKLDNCSLYAGNKGKLIKQRWKQVINYNL